MAVMVDRWKWWKLWIDGNGGYMEMIDEWMELWK